MAGGGGAGDVEEEVAINLLIYFAYIFLTALPVLSDNAKMAKTSCPDWYGLNYTLPMFLQVRDEATPGWQHGCRASPNSFLSLL